MSFSFFVGSDLIVALDAAVYQQRFSHISQVAVQARLLRQDVSPDTSIHGEIPNNGLSSLPLACIALEMSTEGCGISLDRDSVSKEFQTRIVLSKMDISYTRVV